MGYDKLKLLLQQALYNLDLASKTNNKLKLWQAYVNIEYAILDIKLRHNIWSTINVNKNTNTNLDLTANINEGIGFVKNRLEKLDTSDNNSCLKELRTCRDILKKYIKS